MRANSQEPWKNKFNKLSEAVLDNYDIVEANTPELRDICHRLRYQVYCVENPFEDAAENSDGQERDVYDDFSAHALALHQPTGTAVGTVRLVLPGATVVPPLPMLGACGATTSDMLSVASLAHTAEISRHAISKKFRQMVHGSVRQESMAGPDAQTHRSSQREIDTVTLALFRACIGLAARNDIQFFCALMKKAWLRRVGRLGIYFDKIGEDVEFHGWRQPSAVSISVMLDRVLEEREDVWRIITDDGVYASAFSKPLAAE